MKKKNNLPVEFYVDPHYTYKEHKLNILKECLKAWLEPENRKFYPFKDTEFKYIIDYVEHQEGNEVAVFHCYTTYDWVCVHNLYDSLIGLISFFE